MPNGPEGDDQNEAPWVTAFLDQADTEYVAGDDLEPMSGLDPSVKFVVAHLNTAGLIPSGIDPATISASSLLDEYLSEPTDGFASRIIAIVEAHSWFADPEIASSSQEEGDRIRQLTIERLAASFPSELDEVQASAQDNWVDAAIKLIGQPKILMSSDDLSVRRQQLAMLRSARHYAREAHAREQAVGLALIGALEAVLRETRGDHDGLRRFVKTLVTVAQIKHHDELTDQASWLRVRAFIKMHDPYGLDDDTIKGIVVVCAGLYDRALGS